MSELSTREISELIYRVPDDPPRVDRPEESIDDYGGIITMRPPIGDDDVDPVRGFVSIRTADLVQDPDALEGADDAR